MSSKLVNLAYVGEKTVPVVTVDKTEYDRMKAVCDAVDQIGEDRVHKVVASPIVHKYYNKDDIHSVGIMSRESYNELVYNYSRDTLYSVLKMNAQLLNELQKSNDWDREYRKKRMEPTHIDVVDETNIRVARLYGWGWFATGVAGVLSHLFW